METFLSYMRAGNSLDEDWFPIALFGRPYRLFENRYMMKSAHKTDDQPPANAILALQCQHKMDFILRYGLQLNVATVASDAGLTEGAVGKTSFQALLKIRELLRRVTFKEQIE